MEQCPLKTACARYEEEERSWTRRRVPEKLILDPPPPVLFQNAYINSVDDFCLWAPPSLTSDYGNSAIANTERLEVS